VLLNIDGAAGCQGGPFELVARIAACLESAPRVPHSV
jgi:hypothetical protein